MSEFWTGFIIGGLLMALLILALVMIIWVCNNWRLPPE